MKPTTRPNPILASGALSLLAVAVSVGAEYLVSTVAQFNSALAAAQPGDTILLANQVWTNADLLFKKNGTPTQPVTLRAQTPGHVIFSGQSRLRVAGSWLVVDGLRFENGYYTNGGSAVISFRESSSVLATNCAVLNCAIVNYNPPLASVDSKWVSLYGLSNRVENCFFQGKSNLGATLVVWLPSSPTNLANHHIIRRNHFGFRPPLGENGAETIRIGDSATSFNLSRTLVEENLFRACNGEIETVSNKSCENVYRYNTFERCEGTLTLRHGNRCEVYGNWFLGRGAPQSGGVRIIGEDHLVFNNYLDGLTGTGLRSAICFVNGVPNSALNEYFQVQRARVLFNT
ncbi:MAG: polysaccharide lyase 6 family protein, partial [Verrucomicrobiales bacterium]|nr:polysaccharide lyase 6 family protein [Verrucomicrobiales bacterium]